MIQSQLGNTDSNSLLDLDGQVQALRMELEEVKEADDEEIERLLDQNGTGYLLQWHLHLHYLLETPSASAF